MLKLHVPVQETNMQGKSCIAGLLTDCCSFFLFIFNMSIHYFSSSKREKTLNKHMYLKTMVYNKEFMHQN